MGRSIYIIGQISSKSEQYKKHAKVVKACYDADIKNFPEETAKFFNQKHVDINVLEEYLEVDISKNIIEKDSDGESQYIIKIKDLPKEIDKIIIYG